MSIFKTIEHFEDENEKSAELAQAGLFAIGASFMFVALWVLAGLAAFVWSLVCFGKSGTTTQKVIGLLISLVLGPFYWIYFYVSKDYCR